MKHAIRLITLAAALALGGCEKKATGQVVAVVNGEEISQQELNVETQNARLPADVDKKAVTAQILQRLIDRKLLVQKAKKDGLDRTPEFLLQSRRTADDMLIGLLANRAGKTVSVPDQAAVTQFINGHPTLFNGRTRYTLDQVAFQLPADKSVLKQLGPIHDFDGVVSTLTAAGVELKHGTTTLDSASIPPEIASKIAALKPGEPFIVPVAGGYVANVIRAAQPVPVNPAEAKPAAVELVRRQKIDDAVKAQLKVQRDSAKIDYQPGFAPKTPTK